MSDGGGRATIEDYSIVQTKWRQATIKPNLTVQIGKRQSVANRNQL
jgi:hypothetical protein